MIRSKLYKLLLCGILILTMFVMLLTCTSNNPTEIIGNRRPDTHLFLYPGIAGLDTTLSTQILHWWGDDPDGQVMGYYYSWDFYQEASADSFQWTTEEYDTFLVPIRQKYDEFEFFVKAVDNSALWDYPELKKSNTDNEYFQDSGEIPGQYDAGDIPYYFGGISGIQTAMGAPLEDLEEFDIYKLPPTDTTGAVDATPADLNFPVRNSKPSVRFVYESNPPDSIYAETFTTRTFFWTANDSDGIETITNYYYYLADPGETPPSDVKEWPNRLPGLQKNVTLRNLSEGFHVFYLAVEDIAGDLSPVIRYPAEKGRWYVKEPYGDLLLVDDYEPYQDIGTWTTDFYNGVLDTMTGVNGFYSNWKVESLVPYSVTDIFETMNFFDKVIWYGDSNPHFQTTASSIYRYIASGKKIMINSVSPTRVVDGTDSLYLFLKSDSLAILDGVLATDIGRASKNSVLESQLPETYPDLTLANFISYIDALIPSALSDSLYLLDKPPRGSTIQPCLGIRYPKGGPDQFIYLNFPLHYAYDVENPERAENAAVIELLRQFLAD
ncbi:MAG: hypothetical protein V2J62_11385 [candidate division KSB1 bacterium]|nr:hypothetical protein [candidate division KSB1 bacterium]